VTAPAAGGAPGRTSFAIVVPTIGRASLPRLLESLAACTGPRPVRIVLSDDRRGAATPLPELPPGWPGELLTVVRSGGRGPAAARNAGWRAVTEDVEWIAFVDDDVLVTPTWLDDLASDLAASGAGVGGTQARVTVPLPADRRPTDWERGTAGLASAKWITADMAYRLAVLRAVGGFDERFPRAFREDADLALRVENAGFTLNTGARRIIHPVRPAPWNASVKQQRGNADDVLMTRLHGRDWWTRAQAPVGRRAHHLWVTGAGVGALASAVLRRGPAAAVCALAWAAGTAQFARVRIRPGPHDPAEVARMAVTSVAIPPTAVFHWLRGLVVHRAVAPLAAGGVDAGVHSHGPRSDGPALRRVSAVLVDRDGTIVVDVPYNADPEQVEPMPGAREALDRVRSAGLPVGVISNQSGVASGLITPDQLAAVNARVEELLGPFDVWQVCPHAADDGCACRKPQPGMVVAAADALGVAVDECVVIGDIGSDVAAAERAGAQAVLVPTPVTRAAEVEGAGHVFATLPDAVDAILARAAAR
jgi:histidinol-phosphate phosphatase family protein